MKKSLVLLSAGFLLMGTAFAKDGAESSIGFSNNQGATSLIFDVAGEKHGSTVGVRGEMPLNDTARAVQAMNERWYKKPKSGIELYGTIDIGYSYTSR
jgi:hypothetical protein